jgi:hypothetical protein
MRASCGRQDVMSPDPILVTKGWPSWPTRDGARMGHEKLSHLRPRTIAPPTPRSLLPSRDQHGARIPGHPDRNPAQQRKDAIRKNGPTHPWLEQSHPVAHGKIHGDEKNDKRQNAHAARARPLGHSRKTGHDATQTEAVARCERVRRRASGAVDGYGQSSQPRAAMGYRWSIRNLVLARH